MKDLSTNIIAIRKHRGMSQRDLADRAGVSLMTISSIEKGGDCKVSTIRAIEKALDAKII